ncbi:Uncharacterised protein [Mycobacteroides abscessus subsp. abscessus]|nr:Uncharacterised protein [Mycobacteroides abscessus subsp. abscessus]
MQDNTSPPCTNDWYCSGLWWSSSEGTVLNMLWTVHPRGMRAVSFSETMREPESSE